MSSKGLTEVKVPALGESIREATIVRWLKAKGDSVTADEVLVELETDKVTLEVNAPASGVLTEVRAVKGGVVGVGDVLGVVEQGEKASAPAKTPAAAPSAAPPPSAALPAVAPPATEPSAAAPPPSPAAAPAAPAAASVARSSKKGEQTLSPAVRKLTEEKGINSEDIVGTGKGGRITKGDVLHLDTPPAPSEQQEEKPARSNDQREERVKMTRLRQRIAERLKNAQNTAAILTTFNEVDMTAINALRKKYKEGFEKRHGIRLGVMSFFVKACVQALKESPAVNAEIDGDEIIYKNYYDIGVAVSTPQGLVVPIVRDADQLSFSEVERAIASLGQKARDGKLSMAEMTGGTFTVSNGGVFGSLLSTPILNPPQTGILGMHKIQERPVVIDGKIEIRAMMYLALSYDHRVIDGRESVSFLVRVKENLENPERLLLDM
jgi:2-oxoglutarate dehydrogenase E2 component (dihydrolipoamide succinyltransferase)